MPLYVYECDRCGHRIEELQKLGDPAPASCEDCPQEGGCHFVKQMTSCSFDFQASEGVGGWEGQGELLVRKKRGKLGPARVFDSSAKKARKKTG